MTQAEKECINKLRAEGLGSVRIAKKLGLSENTVKSYLRRSPDIQKAPDSAVVNEGCCKQCSAPLLQSPRNRAKLFCSDACRAAWWSTHKGKLVGKTTIMLRCASCGTPFGSFPSENRKYCCHACYIKDRFGGEHHNSRAV